MAALGLFLRAENRVRPSIAALSSIACALVGDRLVEEKEIKTSKSFNAAPLGLRLTVFPTADGCRRYVEQSGKNLLG